MALRLFCLLSVLLGIGLVYGTVENTHNVRNAPYNYTIRYFNQSVDHFNFANTDIYPMRYLFNAEYFDSATGAILFYCGNEGDIENFAANTGLMWELAAPLKSVVLFAEHRYYGKSMPYGNDSFKDAAHYGYLTSEQALADYAVFIDWFKMTTRGAAHAPVIAFGGSYGGMLAAWMRAKYPHIIAGSLAGSAPVLQYEGVTACESYDRIVTKTFSRYGDNCVENIRRSWKAIDDMYKSGVTGQDYLKATFNLCKDIRKDSDVLSLKGWLAGAWGNVAMVEYPYPANFIQNLPAWPIKDVCTPLQQPYWKVGQIHIRQMAQAAQAYFNYSSSFAGSCFDTTAEPDDLGADQGWGFQACSEQIMPMCADNKQDFFEPSAWSLDAFVKQCATRYKIKPRPYWILTNFLGPKLSGVTNIIFSNGILDPWHGGGVLQSIPEQNITAIIIPHGAHHLDLRASNPADPPDVVAAREYERKIIVQWIRDARSHY